MACCIIAAFIIAQIMAMFRRWAMFWGFVPVPADEPSETIFTIMRRWFSRPAVRGAFVALLLVESAVLGTWLYRDHRHHIMEIAGFGSGETFAAAKPQFCSDGDVPKLLALQSAELAHLR